MTSFLKLIPPENHHQKHVLNLHMKEQKVEAYLEPCIRGSSCLGASLGASEEVSIIGIFIGQYQYLAIDSQIRYTFLSKRHVPHDLVITGNDNFRSHEGSTVAPGKLNELPFLAKFINRIESLSKWERSIRSRKPEIVQSTSTRFLMKTQLLPNILGSMFSRLTWVEFIFITRSIQRTFALNASCFPFASPLAISILLRPWTLLY